MIPASDGGGFRFRQFSAISTSFCLTLSEVVHGEVAGKRKLSLRSARALLAPKYFFHSAPPGLDEFRKSFSRTCWSTSLFEPAMDKSKYCTRIIESLINSPKFATFATTAQKYDGKTGPSTTYDDMRIMRV